MNDMVKDRLRDRLKDKIRYIYKNYLYVVFAVLALLIPDMMLRNPIYPGVWISCIIYVVSTLFSIGWAAILLTVCLIILPKRTGRIIYAIFNSIAIILSVCQYVYFEIFGQFFWVKSIFLAGEGAEYLDTALTYIDFKLVFFVAASITFMVLALKRWEKPQVRRKKIFLWMLSPIFGLAALHIFMLPQTFGTPDDIWDAWAHPRLIYRKLNNSNKSMITNGLYQMTVRDIYRSVRPVRTSAEDIKRADEYFDEKTGLTPNDYTGLFEGKNVIAVMMESIDTWVIDEKYTPTIKYMMENGIEFTDFYAPTFGTGHTFNSEFAFNTGFFCPLSEINATNFTNNKFPLSVANMFKAKGYAANSFHFNTPGYYNRGVMHGNFGYEAYNSFSSMGMSMNEAKFDSKVINNDEIYNKMIEKQPFFDFVITYSAHLPYVEADNDNVKKLRETHPELIDPEMDEEENNCKILASDTDEFFRGLLTRLEEDGLLDNTVIIAFTDHYTYGISDPDKLAEYKEGELLRRVPAFIYAKDIKPEKISKPSQTIDLLPTMLNLFAIETEEKFMGNDILSPENQGFVYFENGAWKTGEIYYDPDTSSIDPSQQKYVEEQNARVQEYFDITEIVVSGDYFGVKGK